MNANELRIGNLVLDSTGNVHKIERLDEKWDFSDRKPIPLTEEILLKFGFAKENNELFYDRFNFTKGTVTIYYDSSKGEFIFLWPSIQVKYVHQLQNLHFALTGEESQLADK